MDAVLLAAGLGTRLKPLTDVLPKCLAPIRGRPLLEYWLRMLFGGGVDRAVVNTHYHAEVVEQFLVASPWASRVSIAREKELLGTGGTVLANAPPNSDEPLIVIHADNLSVFDPKRFVRAHEERPAATAITMMTFSAPDPTSCGIVTVDGHGVVTGFYEKVPDPPGNRANAAVYIFETEILRFMRSLGRPYIDISLDVLPRYIGRIATWHNDAYHRDIGTLDSWRAAQLDYPVSSYSPPNPDPWEIVLSRMDPRVKELINKLLNDKSSED